MNLVAFIRHPTVAEFVFEQRHADRLSEKMPGCTVTVCNDQDAFLSALPEADGVLIWRFEQAWFARAPRLRLISTPAAGRDFFSVSPPSGVQLLYGAFHGRIMGETVAAMVLGVSRGLIPHANLMKTEAGKWPHDAFSGHIRTVSGAQVVILGFGAIGHHAAQFLKPFGARIIGVRRHPEGDTAAGFGPDDRVIGIEALDGVLPTTDHLVCVLPSGSETHHLIDARRLALLPPHACVYNVGRGNAIDEDALVSALARRVIAGAVLDVFETEPLPADSPLRRTPNAWLFPHVSAVAPSYMDAYVDELAARLAAEPACSSTSRGKAKGGGEKQVLVVILNWNGLEFTRACCHSLREQTYAAHEVWVVDNGSTEHAVDVLRTASVGANLLPLPENRGFAGGVNAALAAADLSRFDYVWLLNNDTLCDPDALQRLISTAETNPQFAAVGCALREPAGKGNRTAIVPAGVRLRPPFYIPQPARGATMPDYLCGASLLLRREALETLGWLDDAFFFFFEDADWCFRARRAGWLLGVAPGAPIVHAGGGTIRRQSRNRAYYYRAGHVRFLRRHVRHPALAACVPFIYRLCADILHGRLGAVAGSVAGFRAGWKGPCG